VGDRKILRFLRGHNNLDIEKVSHMITKFLDWRKEHKVDEIRQNILLGGLDSPSKFPYSELVLELQPQCVMCPYAQNKEKSPIYVEKFSFSPTKMLKHMTTTQFFEFFTYCLEYRSLILEQFSEERDNEYINSLKTEEEKNIALSDKDVPGHEPYGTLVGLCIIRDLDGIGFEHVGSFGQEIVGKAIAIFGDNYPELVQKCYFINSPWIFNALWWFIHGLISKRSADKIVLIGHDYKHILLEGIDECNIPNLVGGPYCVADSNITPFVFNKQYFYPDMSEEEINELSRQLHESNSEKISKAVTSVLYDKNNSDGNNNNNNDDNNINDINNSNDTNSNSNDTNSNNNDKTHSVHLQKDLRVESDSGTETEGSGI
jgi:hypothetical protein